MPAIARSATVSPSDPPEETPVVGQSKAGPAPGTPVAGSGDLADLTSVGKGASDQLSRYGIYLNGGYVGTDLTQLSGGVKRGSAYANDLSFGADFDLQQIYGIPGAQMHIVGDERFGGVGSGFNPFNGSGIGYITGAGPSNQIRLAELTYEQAFFHDQFEARIGRLSSTFYLTNLATDCQFITFTCGNPAGWGFNNAQVFWPYATYGAQFTARPTPATYVRFGVYQDDAVDVTKTGTPFDGSFDFKHTDGVFLPLEIGYQSTFATDPYPRHYSIGFYYDTKQFADNRFNSAGQPIALAGGTPGIGGPRSDVYLEATQTIYKPSKDSLQSLQIFGGAYFGTTGQSVIDSYFTYGLIKTGTFESRPNDQIAFLGVVSNFDKSVTDAIADRFLAATGQTGAFQRTTEGFELNYLAELAPGVTLRPFADIIVNPDQEFIGNPNPNRRFSFGIGGQIAINLNRGLGFSLITPVH